MICSNCNAPLPKWRKPDSLGQLLLGGWTCANCQTVLDTQGRAIVGGYKTLPAALVLIAFFAGIGLSNYLVFFAQRPGLSMLTLVLTLVLGFGGARLLRPKTRTSQQ